MRFLRHWQKQLLLRQAILALAVALALAFVLLLWLPLWQAALWAVLLWLCVWLLLHWRKPFTRLNLSSVAAWLDQQHPQLQYSSSLLLEQPDSLSIPARLQQKRTEKVLHELLQGQKAPVDLPLLMVRLR